MVMEKEPEPTSSHVQTESKATHGTISSEKSPENS